MQPSWFWNICIISSDTFDIFYSMMAVLLQHRTNGEQWTLTLINNVYINLESMSYEVKQHLDMLMGVMEKLKIGNNLLNKLFEFRDNLHI